LLLPVFHGKNADSITTAHPLEVSCGALTKRNTGIATCIPEIPIQQRN